MLSSNKETVKKHDFGNLGQPRVLKVQVFSRVQCSLKLMFLKISQYCRK